MEINDVVMISEQFSKKNEALFGKIGRVIEIAGKKAKPIQVLLFVSEEERHFQESDLIILKNGGSYGTDGKIFSTVSTT